MSVKYQALAALYKSYLYFIEMCFCCLIRFIFFLYPTDDEQDEGVRTGSQIGVHSFT